ncbi:MAG: DEAD/DEAH box helicase family protein [Myxococcales bacterium]|nr:DEAD/DEAH box helicase family protein [Myxococcales bacterium]
MEIWQGPIMILWNHQRQALDLIDNNTIRNASRSLVVMPPGAGKSEVACQSVLAWLRLSVSHRAVVCVPNRRLLGQFYSRLASLTREPIAFEQGTRRPSSADRIVLASQLSLIDRLSYYSIPDTLLIIDEVHHSNYDAPEFRRVLRKFERSIGLSATPWTNRINDLFSACYFYSLSNAVKDHVICPFDVKAASALSPSVEYHTLVFVSSNKDAREKASRFVSSDWIGHRRENSENLSVLDRWQTGKIKTIFANRMLLEGYDTPLTSCVWIDFDVSSVVMCAQMIGRALRYRPEKKANIYALSAHTVEAVNEAICLMDCPPK